jgi:hypothetical protein
MRERCGEIGIMSAPSNGHSTCDMSLIFPVQIEPRLNNDATIDPERLSKGEDFTSSVRSQFKEPFDAIQRLAAPRCRLETPPGKPNLPNMLHEVAGQVDTMKSRQCSTRIHTERDRSRS